MLDGAGAIATPLPHSTRRSRHDVVGSLVRVPGLTGRAVRRVVPDRLLRARRLLPSRSAEVTLPFPATAPQPRSLPLSLLRTGAQETGQHLSPGVGFRSQRLAEGAPRYQQPTEFGESVSRFGVDPPRGQPVGQ